MTFAELTITTSCVGYGKYLREWADSILMQSVKPGRVCIFTHGSQKDYLQAETEMLRLIGSGISAYHTHSPDQLDFGTARNRAIELAETEWVMHLDADDMLYPGAIENLRMIAPTADVVQAGYQRVNCHCSGVKKMRLYEGGDGLKMLEKSALASGNSMFRRSLWQQKPYRVDMLGAWDTALWIGFARLGARFRPSTQPIFQYRQHADSIFNQRVSMMGWSRVHTNAMLKALRRGYDGVAVVVPRDRAPSPERQRNWAHVLQHYQRNHPDWQVVEGFCHTKTWVKGAAIADALTRCNADVIVIADADVIVDPLTLERAVDMVKNGVPWAIPHRMVLRLDEEATKSYIAGVRLPFPWNLERKEYEGVPGGGIFVVRHVNYDAVGGIPFAFRGWGSEDKCLAFLCEKLLGHGARLDADLVHLSHPLQPGAKVAHSNVQLLQNLGYAAQNGRDALVQAVMALPRPNAGVYQAAARSHRMSPIPTQAIQQRMEQRRMP